MKRSGISEFLFVIIVISIIAFLLIKYPAITGFAVIGEESFGIMPADDYKAGDLVKLNVWPADADYIIEIYDPDKNLIANGLYFIPEKEGEYKIKALLFFDNKTEKVETVFFVSNKEEDKKNKEKPNITKKPYNITNETKIKLNNKTKEILDVSLKNEKRSSTAITLKNVEFSQQNIKEDVIIEKGRPLKVTTLENDGARIEIKGVGKKDIKEAWVKDNIIYINHIDIEEATIRIPVSISAVLSSDIPLFIKEDNETEFKLAEPYKKNGKDYNKVILEDGYLSFNIEHLSSYTIGPADYWVLGKVGNSLNFSGSYQHIDVADYDLINNFTAEAWIYTRNVGSSHHYIINKQSGSDYGWWFRILSSGTIDCQIRNSTDIVGIDSGFAPDTEVWYHAACRYNSTDICIFINGTLTACNPATGDIRSNDLNIQIGKISDRNGFYWNGLLDEIRLYNRSLSEEEINASFALGLSGLATNVSAEGLVGEWKLDEASGITAYDSSGNGLNGTLIGYTPFYNTLQECLDAKNNTDSCCLISKSNYEETLQQNTYSIGDSDCGIKYNADNITIDFNGSIINAYNPSNTYLIQIENSKGTILNAALHSFLNGTCIYLNGATESNIINNTFQLCGKAIYLNNTDSTNATENKFENSTYAIYQENSVSNSNYWLNSFYSGTIYDDGSGYN
ncbi:MAG: hypothetical protein N3D84_01060, partial [Candidatus Woesearchaeota archaeon]|nr:hypothetical protein [Candidatus Woesearchaeota archaeon]